MSVQPFPSTDITQWSDPYYRTGSHRLPDGSCCHCGPANHLHGPQYVCDCHAGTRVEGKS